MVRLLTLENLLPQPADAGRSPCRDVPNRMNQTEDPDLQTTNAIGPWTLLAGILLLAFVTYLAFQQIGSYVTERSTEHYKSMGAAEILTEYMERNGGAWPTTWDNLAEFMGKREFVGIGNYEDLQKYVEIDFDFEPSSVDLTKEEHDNPSFDCIRMKSGRTVEGEWNPNQMVLAYLLRKSKAQ